MPDVTLGYTKVAIEDCEDAWTSAQGANVTCGTSDSTYQVGTKSATITVLTDATTGIIAYEDFSAVDLSACTHIGFWVIAGSAINAGDFQICIDETSACVSPSESINIPAMAASKWYYFCLPFASIASTRNATISVGLNMVVDSTVAIYIDDVAGYTAMTYPSYYCMGLRHNENPEYEEKEVKYLDGSLETGVLGFRRVVNFQTEPVSTAALRNHIHDWKMSTDQYVFSEYAICSVVCNNIDYIWLNEYQEAKSYLITAIEKTMRTTKPASWSL